MILEINATIPLGLRIFELFDDLPVKMKIRFMY